MLNGRLHCARTCDARSWWKHWIAYSGFGTDTPSVEAHVSAPGPIPNNLLLQQEGVTELLKDGIRENADFVLVNEAAWTLLVSWYGGGPAVKRPTVIEGGVGGRVAEVQLELTLLAVSVHLHGEHSAAAPGSTEPLATPMTVRLSRQATVDALIELVNAAWNLAADAARCRLWDFDAKKRRSLLNTTSKLDEAGLSHGHDVLLELASADGKWPLGDVAASSAGSNSTATSSTNRVTSSTSTSGTTWSGARGLGVRENTVVDEAKPSTSGVVGLTNLGNTCFMNSMLQCLSNVEALRRFFVSGDFEEELNPDNPLGAEGQLAEAFSALLKLMWGNDASVVSPRHFKAILGRFAPQFAGYGQQDSQELCNYVLDKLHEDVNRVRKKPYVENFEAKGNESDDFIASEVHKRHRMRNDSRIADLFEGYFKSTVVCPTCERMSVTFDPFMSVAVPLGIADTRKLTVTLVTFGGALHNLRVTVPISGSVHQLLAAVAQHEELPHALSLKDLVCVEVYNSKLQVVYTADSKLEKMQNNDFIFAYETVPPAEADSAPPLQERADDQLAIVCVQRAPPSGYGSSSKFLGLPIVLSVPRSVSGRQLYGMISRRLHRYQRTDAEYPEPSEAVDGHAATTTSDDLATATASAPTATNLGVNGAPADATALPASAPRSEQWRLFYSTMAPGSFGYEALEDAVPLTDEPCEFATSVRGSSGADSTGKIESRHVVLEWQAAAFAGRGHYDRAKVEGDEADQAGIGCGRQPAGERKKTASGGVDLRACLDLFSREETLDSENCWYCDRCKQHREASKKLQIWSLPSVLVVHLKRFSAQGMWRRKNDTAVDFPFEIDLAPYQLQNSGEPLMYDLTAVSNHYGSTGGGHYTAFAKHSENGQWYKFDDSYTSAVEPKDVVTPAAYVLIYVRRGLRADDRAASPEM